jgi:hypothetical protein
MGAYSLLDNGPNFCTSLPRFGWVILFHLARFHKFVTYIGMCNFLINPLKKTNKTPPIVLTSSENLLVGQLLNLNQNNLTLYIAIHINLSFALPDCLFYLEHICK